MSKNSRSASVVIMLLLAGCANKPRGERPFETNPVTGVVHIDGLPADRVQVDFHPSADSTTIKYPLSTLTDEEGRFSVTTYESGDGVPEGTYTLTFQWLDISLAPTDQLKGAYADPKTSEHIVKVVKNQPNDLGVIELSSTGPE